MDEKLLFDVIRASFNQRRKTLLNGICNYEGLHFSKEMIAEAIQKTGLDLNVRGETLSLEQFAHLTDAILTINTCKND